MLRDFIDRIQSGEQENLNSLPTNVLTDIRTKKLDKLDHYIVCAKKYCLFGEDVTLYSQLEELKTLRNKVHIQGHGGKLEADERKAFSVTRMKAAEKVVEYISKYLATNYPRPSYKSGFVNELRCHWEPHYR